MDQFNKKDPQLYSQSHSKILKLEILRFLVVGTSTVFVDWMSYCILLWLGLNLSIAKAGGFIIGTVFAYFTNRFWTFQTKTTRHVQQFVRFIFLYAVTLGLNVATNAFLLFYLEGKDVGLLLSFLGATTVSATLNFLGMKFFVFVPLALSKEET